jgi:hypothetical protein
MNPPRKNVKGGGVILAMIDLSFQQVFNSQRGLKSNEL